MVRLLAADVSTEGGAVRANLSKTFVFRDENAPPRRSGIGGGAALNVSHLLHLERYI